MCTRKGFLVPRTQHKHTTRNINKCKQQMRLNPKRLRLVIRVGLGCSDKCCEVEKLGACWLITKPLIFERTTSHSKEEPAYSLKQAGLGSGFLHHSFGYAPKFVLIVFLGKVTVIRKLVKWSFYWNLRAGITEKKVSFLVGQDYK